MNQNGWLIAVQRLIGWDQFEQLLGGGNLTIRQLGAVPLEVARHQTFVELGNHGAILPIGRAEQQVMLSQGLIAPRWTLQMGQLFKRQGRLIHATTP